MKTRITHGGLILACLAASNCTVLRPRPDPSRFFVLAPLAEPQEPAAAEITGLSVSLGPIHFPSYLNRPQLATRRGPNELYFSEHRRWAEPLEDNFTRVLAANLAALLGTERVTTHFQNQPAARSYRVAIDVLRFEVTEKRRAELTARWAVGQGGAERTVNQSTFSAEARSDSTADAVAALSECLGNLSRAITAAVEEREQERAQHPSVP